MIRYKNLMIIIILAVAAIGLGIATILLSINKSNQQDQINNLTAQIDELKDEKLQLEEKVDIVGMATCLLGGNALLSEAKQCRLSVDFLTKEKTTDELKEFVDKVGYGY